MIVLLTDFGSSDLYAGQVKAAILAHAPDAVIVDLLHDVPAFSPKAGAHLLAALAPQFPVGSVFFAVVDPGVGGQRDAVALLADEKWYVGPDNGLLSVVAARSASCEHWRIAWRPRNLSCSFHGRDLFAPVAAWLDHGTFPHGKLEDIAELQVNYGSADLAEIIYLDHYGNAMTGLRTGQISRSAKIVFGCHALGYARVFSDVPAGQAFWYENSNGLVEIAVNSGCAAEKLGLRVGQAISFGC
ncbi:MAG: SAM-dependent chlorinase/fluorinase [Pseudomonadota bacterium]|jgi:S-adenosylmethionine hydrolase